MTLFVDKIRAARHLDIFMQDFYQQNYNIFRIEEIDEFGKKDQRLNQDEWYILFIWAAEVLKAKSISNNDRRHPQSRHMDHYRGELHKYGPWYILNDRHCILNYYLKTEWPS